MLVLVEFFGLEICVLNFVKTERNNRVGNTNEKVAKNGNYWEKKTQWDQILMHTYCSECLWLNFQNILACIKFIWSVCFKSHSARLVFVKKI